MCKVLAYFVNYFADLVAASLRQIAAICTCVFSMVHWLKGMWNTMECKKDNFSGALGRARETHWECVSHALKGVKLILTVSTFV